MSSGEPRGAPPLWSLEERGGDRGTASNRLRAQRAGVLWCEVANCALIIVRRAGEASVHTECAALCWDVIYGGQFEALLQEIIRSGECFTLKELAVNGKDLAVLGLQGKPLGDMLNFLLEYVIDHPENNRKEVLMALASAGTE